MKSCSLARTLFPALLLQAPKPMELSLNQGAVRAC